MRFELPVADQAESGGAEADAPDGVDDPADETATDDPGAVEGKAEEPEADKAEPLAA
jgi:hypothetical protein